MFFILSKVLLFLLMPFWWIVLLLLGMTISKSPRAKKRLLTAAIAVAVIFSNPFLFTKAVLAWQPAPVQLPSGRTYEAGIVLGGMAAYDKNGRGHFGPASDRFIQAANLYHRGIIKRIIVSGGTGFLDQSGPPEALFLKASFLQNGIPDSCIIIEPRSRNTYENAVYTRLMTDSMHLHPPFVLITSAVHMKRSEHVFRKAGFDFVSFPCNYTRTEDKFYFFENFAPMASVLDEWAYLLKEMVGLVAYKLTGKA